MRYNNVFKQAYTVVSPYDINLNPNHAVSVEIFVYYAIGNYKGMIL